MASSKDRTRMDTSGGSRKEPRNPDDVLPKDDQRGAPNAAPKGTASQAKPPARKPGEAPPDANPGREYQGTGIQNQENRFGSSTKPSELVDSPDAAKGKRESQNKSRP